MPSVPLKINTIFEGRSPSDYFGMDGTFNDSVGVDPDLPASSSTSRTSGFAMPVGYTSFSGGTNVNAAVVRIVTTPKNTNVYVVLSNGKLISYSSALGSETLIGTVAGSTATWAEYYNNYIYIFGTGASTDDISRYGPLNNSPTLVDNVWKGATLGSNTALTNTTYPTLRGISMPNHVAYVHGDGSMYFTDFINGQGLIHRINTKKVTNEGDTNGTLIPSLYNALDLPFGFYPTALCNYGTSIIILGNFTTDTTIAQGKAALLVWDPTNTISWYIGPVPIADPLGTALLNRNGIVTIWSGNASGGYRVSQYLGGESIKDLLFVEDTLPPLAGAVDTIGNRIVWGGFISSTDFTGPLSCVLAYGSKDVRLPNGLHNVATLGTTGETTPMVTAVRYVQQANNSIPRCIAARTEGANTAIFKYASTTTLNSQIKWKFNIGQKFYIRKILIPLTGAVDANTSITLNISTDGSSVLSLPITNTVYSGKTKIVVKGTELKNCLGSREFNVSFSWALTNPIGIALPITIDVENLDDETTS